MNDLKQKISKAFGKKNVSESFNELTLNIESEFIKRLTHIFLTKRFG